MTETTEKLYQARMQKSPKLVRAESSMWVALIVMAFPMIVAIGLNSPSYIQELTVVSMLIAFAFAGKGIGHYQEYKEMSNA